MQQKKTLSVIFAALILCSSFLPGSFNRFRVFPTASDLFVENNTDENLAEINFISSIDNVTFFNIDPKGGSMGGKLEFDDADIVTITLTFSAPVSGNLIARVYNNGIQVRTINIDKGATSGTTSIAPVLPSGLFVRVYPN